MHTRAHTKEGHEKYANPEKFGNRQKKLGKKYSHGLGFDHRVPRVCAPVGQACLKISHLGSERCSRVSAPGRLPGNPSLPNLKKEG